MTKLTWIWAKVWWHVFLTHGTTTTTKTIKRVWGVDQTAKVWDLSGGVECRSFGSHPTSVVSVKYSASSQLVYTASAYLVSVWDPRRPACVYTLTLVVVLVRGNSTTTLSVLKS